MQKKKIIKTVALLALLIFAYKGTVNLAIYTSENIFQTDILGSFDRVGEFLVKGLNPSAQGRVTIEDNVLVHEIYARYGNDILGAQRYLVQFSFSRLEQGDLLKMFKEKFTLVWASHDALFDYSLTGSNDHKFVNLLRGFEYILWLVITVLILINATFSFKKEVITSTFAIQLFMLGFALLFLFMEVQNRYVAIVIPCSLLLATVGMHQLFSQKIK